MNQAITRMNVTRGEALGTHEVSSKRRLRLLCATDLSPRSTRAVERAAVLSLQLGAELMLFHSIAAARFERVTRRRRVRARIALDGLARRVASAESTPQTVIATGSYRNALAQTAREWNADLIIVGSHQPRLADGILGTTTEIVGHKADRPVLVVNRDSVESYENVLLTSDLSNTSARAAGLAEDLGLLEGAMTSVVHAFTPARLMLRLSGVSKAAVESYERQMSYWTSNELAQQLRKVGLRSAPLPVLADQASPFRAIEHAAQLTCADLVVVGASRFPMLKRVILGSISNEVLRRLECDVLLVPPGAIERVRNVRTTTKPQVAGLNTRATPEFAPTCGTSASEQ